MALIEIDLSDYMDDLETSELEAELRRRRKSRARSDGGYELVHEARDYLMRGQPHDALLTIEKFLFPKFTDEDECLERYRKALAA